MRNGKEMKNRIVKAVQSTLRLSTQWKHFPCHSFAQDRETLSFCFQQSSSLWVRSWWNLSEQPIRELFEFLLRLAIHSFNGCDLHNLGWTKLHIPQPSTRDFVPKPRFVQILLISSGLFSPKLTCHSFHRSKVHSFTLVAKPNTTLHLKLNLTRGQTHNC